MADDLEQMYQARLAATEKPRPRHRVDPYEEASARLDKMIEQAQPAEVPEPTPPAVPSSNTATDAVSSPITPATPPKPEPGWWEKTLGKIKDAAISAGPAVGYGIARGGTLGTVDRLAGAGTWLGEHAAAAMNDTAPPVPNADEQGRVEYLAAEDKARATHPIAFLVGEGLGGAVPAIISGGAAAAVAPTSAAVPTLAESLAPKLATPAAKMAAQGFTAGAMNERSPNTGEQAKAGLVGAGLGAATQGIADATLGRLIPGATEREAKGLIESMVRNEETGASATATAKKLLIPKLAAATKELRSDPVLAEAARTDAARAERIVSAKIAQVAEDKPAAYAAMDSKTPLITVADLQSAIHEASKTARDPLEEAALKRMQSEVVSHWIPKWQQQGMLVSQNSAPMEINSLGVRSWVTEAQSSAADVLGQIKESEAKKRMDALKNVATDLWHKHLDAAEKTAPAAVKSIREHDARISALLSMQKVFQQRSVGETTGAMGQAARLGKAAEGLGTGIAGAYAFEHPSAALTGYAAMQAAKLAPRTARAINDKMLVPLQEALQAGGGKMGWAQFVQLALEKGMPQSMARALYNTFQKGPKR